MDCEIVEKINKEKPAWKKTLERDVSIEYKNRRKCITRRCRGEGKGIGGDGWRERKELWMGLGIGRVREWIDQGMVL